MPSEYRICIIGAGLSGIAAGVQLGRKLGVSDGFVIYDEQEDVGGVWKANTYPGCSSEATSPYYCYSFAPNPDWSGVYAPQQEIQSYLKMVASYYGLYKHLRLQHRVTCLQWDDALLEWRATVLNKASGVETQEIFDIVINCLGALRIPNVPDQFEHFAGPCMHSAEWDHSVDLEGKTVAVVGNGASGVQIIPAIAERVKQLIVYQRNPTWIIPKPQFKYPAVLKAAFRYIPGLLRLARFIAFLGSDALHPGTFIGFLRFLGLELPCKAYLWLSTMGYPDLREKLKPTSTLGCKPPTFASDYYGALRKSNVEMVRTPILDVNKGSITTNDGVERKIDVLILATGFRVQDYFSPLKIMTKGGEDLLPVWKEQGPSLYMGVATSLAPNLFWVAGPNAYVGHSSQNLAVELQVEYILKIVGKMRERGSRVVTVKEKVEKAYMARMLRALSRTVWASADCRGNSFFLDDRGVVTAFNPYSFVSRWLQMRRVRDDDFDFFDEDISRKNF